MDNLLTNKYFCIAVIIALIVVIYLYSQKKSCDVEGMQNVDLTPLAQELTEAPWTNRRDGGNHKEVGNRFDRFADSYTKSKLQKNGYGYTDFLGRSDDTFRDYMDQQNDDVLGNNNFDGRIEDEILGGNQIPGAYRDRSDLSQYQQGCRCANRDRLSGLTGSIAVYDDDDDEEINDNGEIADFQQKLIIYKMLQQEIEGKKAAYARRTGNSQYAQRAQRMPATATKRNTKQVVKKNNKKN